jgi:hypothetical protein
VDKVETLFMLCKTRFRFVVNGLEEMSPLRCP